MNRFKTFLVLFVSFILQTTIFSKIDIYGANLNIMIPAIIALSQVLGQKIGSYGGLVVGLVEDFLFTDFMGVRALAYFLIGSFVGSDRFHFSKDRSTGFIITLAASIFNFLVLTGIYYLLSSSTGASNYLPLALLIESVLNSLIYLVYRSLVNKIMYIPTYRI